MTNWVFKDARMFIYIQSKDMGNYIIRGISQEKRQRLGGKGLTDWILIGNKN